MDFLQTFDRLHAVNKLVSKKNCLDYQGLMNELIVDKQNFYACFDSIFMNKVNKAKSWLVFLSNLCSISSSHHLVYNTLQHDSSIK